MPESSFGYFLRSNEVKDFIRTVGDWSKDPDHWRDRERVMTGKVRFGIAPLDRSKDFSAEDKSENEADSKPESWMLSGGEADTKRLLKDLVSLFMGVLVHLINFVRG